MGRLFIDVDFVLHYLLKDLRRDKVKTYVDFLSVNVLFV